MSKENARAVGAGLKALLPLTWTGVKKTGSGLRKGAEKTNDGRKLLGIGFKAMQEARKSQK